MTPSTLLGTVACAIPVFVALGYLTLCIAVPFRRCRTCAGTGLARRQFGRVSRPCKRCDATGLRLRFGMHLINEARRIHRDGTR